MLKKANQGGGFTLVEVLAAVLLLSVGLLAVISANMVARDTQRRTVNISIARNAAQSIVEDIRAMSFGNIASASFATSDSKLPKGNTISVTTARYPDSTQTNIRKAIVKITWPENGQTREISYETLVVRK